MSFPKTLAHPTFGPCELVPTLIAIRWKEPQAENTVAELLSSNKLALAGEVPKMDSAPAAPTTARDPRMNRINQTSALSWASAVNFTDAAAAKIRTNDKVAWVGPVYRATAAEAGPQSYFAINPTVLLLTQETAAAIGGVSAVDDSATIDQDRGKLLKGYVVVNLPNGGAVEAAAKVIAAAKAKGVTAPGVLFENTPYLDPTLACGCSGATATAAHSGAGDCTPSAAPVLPNDPFFPQHWNLARINAPSAWPLTEGDPNVVVAVLDQGVDLTHPDLNLWPVSYSTITHTNNGGPVGNHGTACAGIIGAKIDNSLGVAGLAGKCKVMAIATNFADTEVAEGLYYAADNGARVVSMSFGVYPSWMIWNFAIIQAALQYCIDKNVVLVAASGNENQNVCRFPGSDPRTLTVGGSNRADVRKAVNDTSVEPFWGACYGPDVDVVAPCLEIPTTDRQGAAGYTPTDYDMGFNGTSSATPHVAALAGLIISINPSLSNLEVRKIISQSTDKINAGAYIYAPTGGKPFGTWNNDVGYGRINAERAVLSACSTHGPCAETGPCAVCIPERDACCISPCDPPWRPDEQCLIWYENRFFRVSLVKDNLTAANIQGGYVEFRITYEHKLCLLGKQHGPLLYTVTLLPKEKISLYHSDRYRRVTSEQARFSVQTTFMQFLSVVHQARQTNTIDILNDRLTSSKSSSSGSSGGGFFLGLFGFGSSGSDTNSTSTTDHNMVQASAVSDQFNQSVVQASQLTHAERSLVVSTFEDKETRDITQRVIENANDCRAVTYFVRQIEELYAVSTIVSDISFRVIAQGVPPEWHSISDIGWLPAPIQAQIKNVLGLLPKVGDVVEKPKPISLPTDGTVYDPELAHCCSCEPEREAAILIGLEKQKAESLKACLEAQMLELELQRRKMLLQKGQLTPF